MKNEYVNRGARGGGDLRTWIKLFTAGRSFYPQDTHSKMTLGLLLNRSDLSVPRECGWNAPRLASRRNELPFKLVYSTSVDKYQSAASIFRVKSFFFITTVLGTSETSTPPTQTTGCHRAGWHSGNGLDLYSRGVLFESRSGHRLSP
jgi:hypothetical protein